MKAYFARRRERGVAAVEFALILILTFFLLPAVFLFARVFYHYNVIKQATQDAANALAASPRIELMTFAGMAAAEARSKQMVINAITASGIYPPDTLMWLPDEIGPAWTFTATSDAPYQN